MRPRRAAGNPLVFPPVGVLAQGSEAAIEFVRGYRQSDLLTADSERSAMQLAESRDRLAASVAASDDGAARDAQRGGGGGEAVDGGGGGASAGGEAGTADAQAAAPAARDGASPSPPASPQSPTQVAPTPASPSAAVEGDPSTGGRYQASSAPRDYHSRNTGFFA